ncbi:Uncharacterised protein (plasmid) [Mesomycoplasma conjunctivae]|nr:Uncharacterised protein [Mesomycoplasma conjunctivae]
MEITSLIQTYKENGIFFYKRTKNRYIQKLKQIIELEKTNLETHIQLGQMFTHMVKLKEK